MNRKPSRRRLARALVSVPRSRLDLLPFYARLTAALAPVAPDLAAEVCAGLTNEFHWHVNKRDQINLESKIKTMRFIGK
ncbi:unnamed protein product [Protopolystoma xenopodis]|uniref:Uncharacterized protein n=1 Tax=Protopolystoma xenopodis TaxID=117903 RepID=A0A448WGG6_9PLAT|nr:unnamed protein product [Protopolystoma xenopodis]